MLRSSTEDEKEPGPDAARFGAPVPTLRRVFLASFVKLLEGVPVPWVRLVGTVALASLGIYSIVRAVGSLT